MLKEDRYSSLREYFATGLRTWIGRGLAIGLCLLGGTIRTDSASSSTTEVEAAGSLYFPPSHGQWEQVDLPSVGWNAEKLNDVFAFASENRSSGLVMLYKGRILAERYWDSESDENGAGDRKSGYFQMRQGRDQAGHVIEDVASIQKSISAVLVGIAQTKGLLRLDDPVDKYLGKGWSRASPGQEKAITIRHLITMTTGLGDDLTYEAPSGTKWRYNSAVYARVIHVVAAAAKMKPNELTGKWLTEPIGMNDSRWIDRTGAPEPLRVNPIGFATTARDLARFGLLILADGQWDDKTVVADREYLHAALRPSQEFNPAYGYLWWLNREGTRARASNGIGNRPLIHSAPPDLVAAIGAGEHRLYIVPSLNLVVTRLGYPAKPGFDNGLWQRLMRAAPKRPR